MTAPNSKVYIKRAYHKVTASSFLISKTLYAQECAGVGVAFGECFCMCGSKTKIIACSNLPDRLVKGLPYRYVKGHGHKTRVLGSARYEEKDTGYSTKCWIWLMTADKEGYGRISLNGKSVAAHRHFFEERYGSISRGLELHHKCEQSLCVNPDHTEALTSIEHRNRHGRSTVSVDDIIKTFELRSLGVTWKSISLAVGIKDDTLESIYSGRRNRKIREEAVLRIQNSI